MSSTVNTGPVVDPGCPHGVAWDCHCCDCRRSGFHAPDDCRCAEDSAAEDLSRQVERVRLRLLDDAKLRDLLEEVEREVSRREASRWAETRSRASDLHSRLGTFSINSVMLVPGQLPQSWQPFVSSVALGPRPSAQVDASSFCANPIEYATEIFKASYAKVRPRRKR